MTLSRSQSLRSVFQGHGRRKRNVSNSSRITLTVVMSNYVGHFARVATGGLPSDTITLCVPGRRTELAVTRRKMGDLRSWCYFISSYKRKSQLLVFCSRDKPPSAQEEYGDEDDDDSASIAASSTTRSEISGRYKSESQRQALLDSDPNCETVEPHRILCRTCHKWIKLSLKQKFALSNWRGHQHRCSGFKYVAMFSNVLRIYSHGDPPVPTAARPRPRGSSYLRTIHKSRVIAWIVRYAPHVAVVFLWVVRMNSTWPNGMGTKRSVRGES